MSTFSGITANTIYSIGSGNNVTVTSRDDFVSVYQARPTGLYHNHHVCLDRNDRQSALRNGDTIEILWPDGSISEHTISTKLETRSFHDRDADETFYDNYHWPYVGIEQNGASLGLTKLTEIEGIKVRKV